MTDLQPDQHHSGVLSYVWAGVVLISIGAVFVLTLLALRPQLDPLILITLVSGIGSAIFASVSAILKAQEIHVIINSRFSEYKADLLQLFSTQGALAAVATEQARVADQLRIKNAVEAAKSNQSAGTAVG